MMRAQLGRVAIGAAAVVLGAAFALGLGFGWSSPAQASMGAVSPEVQIWTDRAAGDVYRVGERAEVHFRPAEDCYVIIYEIDTDGYLRVLFPGDCSDEGYVRGGRVYAVGRGNDYRFYVNGPTGVEYIHVLASYDPFRQVYWDGCDGYEAYAEEASWRGFHDYWGSALPPRVYGDPYIAMESIDEFICQDALEAGLVTADFTYFYVGERVRYPRYLCYDCHGFDPGFRPYVDACVGFSVSFVDCDPCVRPASWWWWCSPGREYCGPRFICYGRDHNGSGGDERRGGRGGHGDWAASYPSEYKWKSRADDGGAGRVDAGRGVVVRSGNPAQDVRVKSGDVKVEDRQLYTRSESKGRAAGMSAKDREVVAREAWKAAAKSTERVTQEAVVVRKSDVKKADARGVEVEKREVRKAESSSGRGVLSRIVEAVKSSGSRLHSETKVVTPEVRRGDKGKSPVTRRTVSR